MKLILVSTGSALICIFCHKLTNYKKSRRYKSNSLSSTINHAEDRFGQSLNGSTFSGSTNPHHLLAYDPYNTIRPFSCLNQPDLTGLTTAAAHLGGAAPSVSTSAYGYHQSSSPFYTPGNLAQFTHSSPGSGLQQHHLDSSAQLSSTTSNNITTTLITNPIFATHLAQPGDCSSFRAQLVEQTLALNNENDVCPSYEEAIAAGVGNNNNNNHPAPSNDSSPVSSTVRELSSSSSPEQQQEQQTGPTDDGQQSADNDNNGDTGAGSDE